MALRMKLVIDDVSLGGTVLRLMALLLLPRVRLVVRLRLEQEGSQLPMHQEDLRVGDYMMGGGTFKVWPGGKGSVDMLECD